MYPHNSYHTSFSPTLQEYGRSKTYNHSITQDYLAYPLSLLLKYLLLIGNQLISMM